MYRLRESGSRSWYSGDEARTISKPQETLATIWQRVADTPPGPPYPSRRLCSIACLPSTPRLHLTIQASIRSLRLLRLVAAVIQPARLFRLALVDASSLKLPSPLPWLSLVSGTVEIRPWPSPPGPTLEPNRRPRPLGSGLVSLLRSPPLSLLLLVSCQKH
jgi:hypothetical protein